MPRQLVSLSLSAFLERAIGALFDFDVCAWDGSTTGAGTGSALVLRNPQALRRVLWRPGQVGATSAFVAGDSDIEGDLIGVLRQLGYVLGASWPQLAGAALAALRGWVDRQVLGLLGRVPAAEVRRSRGARAVRHHYDVGNEFYRLVLGPSMVYSTAYWPQGGEHPDSGLDEAQEAKLDLICRELDLRPGM